MAGKKIKTEKLSKDTVEIKVSNLPGQPPPTMNSLEVSFQSTRPSGLPRSEGISQITISAYKSINSTQSLEIRPLTILAGANSSGKSSFLQPLLLMKQTLESSFDSGALLLNGSHANFSDANQLLSKTSNTKNFNIEFKETSGEIFSFEFSANASRRFDISSQTYTGKFGHIQIYPSMTQEQILHSIPTLKKLLQRTKNSRNISKQITLSVVPNRCFLEITARIDLNGTSKATVPNLFPILQQLSGLTDPLKYEILRTIHLPGLRGNPARTYQKTPSPAVYVSKVPGK